MVLPFLSLVDPFSNSHPHSLNLPQWHNPVAKALSRSALSLKTKNYNHRKTPPVALLGSLSIFYFLFPVSFSLIFFLFFRCSLIYESSPFYCLPVCGFRDLIFFLGFRIWKKKILIWVWVWGFEKGIWILLWLLVRLSCGCSLIWGDGVMVFVVVVCMCV